jgi:hypothetical protein
LKSGETYYISLDLTDRYFSTELFLMEVTANTAKKWMPDLKEEKTCK